MNKLDEIIKPKLSKQEAVTLLRLIFRRFEEIEKKNKHLCIGDYCEDCWYYGEGCDYLVKTTSEMYEVVDKLEEALGINIWLDFDEEAILTMWYIKPDEDDEDWVFAYELRAYFGYSKDYFFEPLSKADIRDSWRFSDRINKIWLEDALEWFFAKEEVDEA